MALNAQRNLSLQNATPYMTYTSFMFVGVGTLINVIAIIVGSAIGVVTGNRIPEKIRTLMTDVLGAITLIGAASAISAMWNQDLIKQVPDGFPILIVLASLLLGGIMGSIPNIEERLDRWALT